jgi:lysozyme
MLKGIDVSKWQGNIDWIKVKNDGVVFAIIRATYGKESVDPCFKINIDEAKKAGVPVGAYHYCYAQTIDEARIEAEHFIKTVKDYSFDYPLVVDMEDKSLEGLDKNTLTAIANTFLYIVKAAGYDTMVYANKYWLENKLDTSKFRDHKIWIARYNNTLGYDGRYDIWQYSSSGKVDGISGNVDMNYCYTDIVKAKPEKHEPVQDKTGDIYTVKAGDTLSGIAVKFNTTYHELAKINNIENPSKILPGQKIKIKGKVQTEARSYYTVKAGDTLSEIATKFNTPINDLVKKNKIKDSNKIYPGQKLLIK